MSELDGQDIDSVALLDADTIPNENQTQTCLSCDEAFTGVYCKNCGQKNDNYRRSLFSLALELGATLTALEGRIWRTWGALLFRPGKVAREFADGARVKWSSPIRTYLAMSLILFGFMAVTKTHIMSIDVNVAPKEGVIKPRDALTAEDLSFQFSMHMLERQSAIDARNAQRDFELIERKILTESGELNLEFGSENAEDVNEDENNGEPAQGADLEIEPPQIPRHEDGKIMLNGKQIEDKQISDFIIDFIRNPAVVTDSFRVWLPRLLFFMMPLTMYIGAIFIRGRGNAMLYDHIIHAAYIHSVLFFLLFIGLLSSYVMTGSTVAKIVFLLMLIYLPLSLKRMFARGWLKTIWTSYGVGFIYCFFLTIGVIVILANTLSKIAG